MESRRKYSLVELRNELALALVQHEPAPERWEPVSLQNAERFW